MLKVGLVGVGGISGAHIPAWDAMEDVQLVALCDVRQEQLAAYESKHCYTDLDEMLQKEDLDILDICLPTFLHTEVALKAMNRGIHVLCEKPVSLAKEDVALLYETAKKNNVRFMVAQVLRFWPEYEALKEIYDSGKYGKLLSGSMRRLSVCPRWSLNDWMKQEARSGLVPFDMHIHDLDFLVYAFGTPEKVTHFRSRMPEQDVLSVVYSYEGFFVTVEAAWYAADYPFQMDFRFQFEKAVVELNGGLKIYELDGPAKVLDTGGAQIQGIDLPVTDGYAREIRYFTDCVKKGTEPDKVRAEELETVIDILKSLT